MTHSSSLLPKTITKQFTSATISRAHTYCNQHSIRSIKPRRSDSINNAIAVEGEVFGSGTNIYSQSILLAFDKNTNTLTEVLDAECSCPFGDFCKHTYAIIFMFNKTLFEELKKLETSPQTVDPTDTTTTFPINNISIKNKDTFSVAHFNRNQFEREFAESLRKVTHQLVQEKQNIHDTFIAYQIKEVTQSGQTWYELHASTVRILKNNSLAKPQKLNLLNLILGYTRYPECATTDDHIILSHIRQSADYNRYYITKQNLKLEGENGSKLLSLLIDTKRLYKAEVSPTSELIRAEELVPEFHWQEINNRFRFNITINGKDQIKVIPTSPAFYISYNNIGQLKSDIAGTQLLLLSQLHDISKEDMLFVRNLIEYSPLAKNITFPKNIQQIKPHKVTPIAMIEFHRAASMEWPYYGYFGDVSFNYEGQLFSPHDGSSPLIDLKGQLIEKDIEFEYIKLLTLSNFGFKKQKPVYSQSVRQRTRPIASYVLESLPPKTPEDQWQDFYLNDLEELKLLGWQVTFADDFNSHYIHPNEIHIDIEDGPQNNWFNVHLSVNHNGQAIDLQPIIVKYLQRSGDKNKSDLLVVLDNKYKLKLDYYKLIEPVINSLLELSDNRGTRLRLPKWQIGSLMSLEEQLGKSGAINYSKAKALKSFVDSLKNIQNLPSLPVSKNVKATLRDYQQHGVSWMQFLSTHGMGGLLADDMGLGKTLQTLAWLQLQKENNKDFTTALIITPTSVIGNWLREAEKFTPNLKILLLHGNDRAKNYDTLLQYDIVVTSYPLILKDEEIHNQNSYSAIILDEAQTIKNAKSKQAQTIFSLATKQRFCLTGTPIENHLGELWSQFNFLMPGFLGNDAQFRKYFKNPIEGAQDTERLKLLRSRIAPFMLRRTKALVAKDLPEKTESIELIELPTGQKQLYESVRMGMEKKVREILKSQGLAKSHIHILDALLKLRQACCHPQLVKLENAQKVNESAKLHYLLEMLDLLVSEDRKVLVFSQFAEMLDIIAESLNNHKINYVQLTGQTKNRQQLIDKFSHNPTINIFLISLKAGGTGLNLVAADTVIHYDPWWNPAIEAQATDRAYRIGQNKPVNVYKLIAKDSVEEKILKLQEKKATLASGLYDKQGQAEFKLSETELMSLFAPLS
ncbi:DEAD/DEAH box helicase [Fastidiosibacter lacustris]|uniref:DEAD/DEAH box helicase n=1 Tax=Fastidiosibacter lacustris TaxID=2056695 RepID=UPI000E34D3D4|nr:DEAD/DEAH box helicase [Fastidiosibacter lacustris]